MDKTNLVKIEAEMPQKQKIKTVSTSKVFMNRLVVRPRSLVKPIESKPNILTTQEENEILLQNSKLDYLESQFKNNRLIKNEIEKDETKSTVNSFNSIQLKKEIHESRKLDREIKKVATELFALEKLEKQKKLNILMQQKKIQLQKLQIGEEELIKKRLSTNLPETNNSISVENFRFPSLIRKYQPNEGFNKASSFRLDNKNLKNNNDQFYLKNKSLTNYNDFMSFEEILRIIEEIENRELNSGNYNHSNYFYNGYWIKPSNDEKRSLSYPSRQIQRNPNFYGPASVLRDDFKTKNFKKVEYLSDGSEKSSVFSDKNSEKSNSNSINNQELTMSNNQPKQKIESPNAKTQFFSIPKYSTTKSELTVSPNSAFKTILPHDLTNRIKTSKEKTTRLSIGNNSNNSNKSKISTVFKELVRENQLNKQKNLKEAKQTEVIGNSYGNMQKNEIKGSISSFNGLVKLSKKSEKSNDSIIKSISTAEKLVAEKKVVIPKPSIKTKKKSFFGKLFKRFRKKKNSKSATTEQKKGITSVYNIDETFNAQTLLIPRPLLDEKTLKILSTNRINISRNNDERTKPKSASALNSLVLKPKLTKEANGPLKIISYPPQAINLGNETNNQFKTKLDPNETNNQFKPNKPINNINNQTKAISYQTNLNTDYNSQFKPIFNPVNLNTIQGSNIQPKPIIYQPYTNQVKPASYPTVFTMASYPSSKPIAMDKVNTFSYPSYPTIAKYQLKPVSFPLAQQSVYNQPKQVVYQSNPALNNYQLKNYPKVITIPSYPPKPAIINRNQFSQNIHQSNKIYGSSEYTRM